MGTNGEETKMVKESRPMVGGDGPNSYAQNSAYQKGGADTAKELIWEGINNNLDFKNPNFDGVTTFTIVDLGCSTGPNTFSTVKNIIEATNHKYQTQIQNPQPLEFQVFFNDLPDNDFNTLFKTLSSNQNYYASGVPGSFYNRLFPKSSIHFVNAFYALHWLSKIPREISESPAMNKESIDCSGSVKEVAVAYLNQFKNDMDTFLNARAEEIAGGGLMAVLIVGRRDGVLTFQTPIGVVNQLLRLTIGDMANLGVINEEKAESFNLPMYYPTPSEIDEIIKRNGRFSIEKSNIFDRPVANYSPEVHIKLCVAIARSIYEGLLKEHFEMGKDTLDQLFHHLTNHIAQNLSSVREVSQNNTELFIILKKNIN